MLNSEAAIKFLESIKRQAEYRRTIRNADPLVAKEAVALEVYLQERLNAVNSSVAERSS
jgi:hypothetical protein